MIKHRNFFRMYLKNIAVERYPKEIDIINDPNTCRDILYHSIKQELDTCEPDYVICVNTVIFKLFGPLKKNTIRYLCTIVSLTSFYGVRYPFNKSNRLGVGNYVLQKFVEFDCPDIDFNTINYRYLDPYREENGSKFFKDQLNGDFKRNVIYNMTSSYFKFLDLIIGGND